MRSIEGIEPSVDITRECSKRIFGNQLRFAVLEYLAADDVRFTAHELGQRFGVPDSTLSLELRHLTKAGVITAERRVDERVRVFYDRNPDYDWQAIAEGLQEVRRIIELPAEAESA